MKKVLLLILLLFALTPAFSQDYYYYKGTRINLNERTDKAAVVLNSNFLSKEDKENCITNLLDNNVEVNEIGENFYLLNFKGFSTGSGIHSAISNLASGDNRIKFATPVYSGDAPDVTQIPTDEFIVRLINPGNKHFLDVLNVQNNVSIVGNVSDEKGFFLKSNDGVGINALQLSQIYFNTGLFEYAEPNFIYMGLLTSIPNDPYFDKQWALRNTGQTVPAGKFQHGDDSTTQGIPDSDMDVDLAWDFMPLSSNVTIGILDTGIDSTHPDFAGSLLKGYDAYYDKYGVPNDSSNFGGHGTCAAGLVIAKMDNAIGISGIAPSCKLMSFRIFNQFHNGTTTPVMIGRAFDTARVLGIDVLSNSWDGGTPSTTMTLAIDNAATTGRFGAGSCILFSSGNNGRNSVWYPSFLPSVISVGASTPLDQKKSPGNGNQFDWGGNYGEDANGDLDLVAPAINYTTDIQGIPGYVHEASPLGDYFGSFSGTSSSCPNTAGVVALILSAAPNLTKDQVLDKLYRGCDKIENTTYNINKTFGKWSEFCGYGRVNAYNSVRLAQGVDVVPPTIIHQNISSHSSTLPTVITAEIVDQDGSPVPVLGDYVPKIIYRTNRTNNGWSDFDSADFSSNDGNIFYFKIPCQGFETHVQYYIEARDNLGNKTTFPFGAPNPFWLCYFGIGELENVSYRIGSFACIDNGVTISPPVSFGNFIILNTEVKINMHHPNISDEIIQLYSPIVDPNNNRKCLFASNGGNGDDIDGAIVTDYASNSWYTGVPPYTGGVFKGDYLLNGLNGTNAEGNWKILNFDQAGNGASALYDSVRVTFTRTSGELSSSVRFNSEEDSVLYFGSINYPDSLLKEFYAKNVGTSDLVVSDITFSGELAYEFFLESFDADPILPGDSARVSVYVRPTLHNAGRTLVDAVMTVTTNDPSKSNFEVSLQYDDRPLPVELSAFNSSVSGRNVSLHWATVMEENNSGFEIERSIDGTDLNYEKIAFVEGSGNTNETREYNFRDANLSSGNYNYRLKQIDYNGNFEYHNLSEVVSVGIPAQFSLSQNYPNPFNPSTKINYDIARDGNVSIKIFDISGRELKSIVNEFKSAGYYTLTFYANNFASGTYFYRIEVNNGNDSYTAVKKMLILK